MDSLDFEVVPFATRLTGANQLVGMIQTGARMPNFGLPRDFPAVVSCSCPALVIAASNSSQLVNSPFPFNYITSNIISYEMKSGRSGHISCHVSHTVYTK